MISIKETLTFDCQRDLYHAVAKKFKLKNGYYSFDHVRLCLDWISYELKLCLKKLIQREYINF